MPRLLISIVLGSLVATLSPVSACSADEEAAPNWQYDEPEMKAAVEGIYVLEAVATGERLTLTLEQATEPSSGTTDTQGAGLRLQCGTVSRSFVKPAGACSTEYETTLPLEARVESTIETVGDGQFAGAFTVIGTQLEYGELRVGTPMPWELHATYRDGGLGEWRVHRGDLSWLELQEASRTPSSEN